MTKETLAQGLREFIALCMDAGATTYEIAEAMEAESPALWRPFQNPEDDSAR